MTMATNTGQIMTLANSIIGVSVLAMPFCFKQCGITLAILMLILSSIMSRLACHYIVKSSIMCRRRNFEFLAFYSFGPSGKLLVELGVIGFMMGTCVAFFVVMGDLGPEIISKLFNISNNNTLRSSVLLGIGLFIVLPLGLLRNVESLAAISTITIGFYLILVIKIFSESFSHLIAGDWMDQVNFWRPEGILQCVPIFAMALSCQTQIFEIYDSLPNPSLEKINYIVRNAVNICTAVYISVGLLGYVSYSTASFTGNVLLSFSPSMSSELCKLGFVLSIAVSFPLVIFPCRASLYSLLFRKMPIHHELSQTSTHIPDTRFKYLTIGIVAVALTTGLLIPSIELVLGFVGSTIGTAICIIFPSLVFIKMTNKDTNERLMAKVTLMLGLVIMVMGTYGNLYAANEGRPIDIVYEKQVPADLKLPPKPDFNPDVKIAKKEETNAIIAVAENKPPNVLEPAMVDKAVIGKPIEASPAKPIPSQPQIPAKPIFSPEAVNKEPVKEKSMDVAPLKIQPDDNKEVNKIHEVINKDAIEKEEKELKEAEKQQKTEEEQKQEELRKILKEHKDEQKKLLQEQEKILKEFKDREKEKKENEVVKEEAVKKLEKEVVVEDVKPIKSEEFKKNIDTIQNVIDGLKDKNQEIKKEKMEVEAKIKEEAPAVKLPNPKPEPEKVLSNQEIKSKIPSVPIPIALLQNNIEAKKSEEVKSKQEAMGRDILGNNNLLNILHREKRDVKPDEENPEECPAKTESTPVEKKEMNNTAETKNNTVKLNDTKIQNAVESEIIKNSEHLSIPAADDSKLKITENSVPADPNLSIIPKKRDLKSVQSRDENSG